MQRAMALVVVLVAATSFPPPAAAEDLWAVRSGAVTLQLDVSLLRDLGIDLAIETPSRGDVAESSPGERKWMFPIRHGSDFRFRVEGGSVLDQGIPGSVLRLGGSITTRDRASGRETR